MIVQRFNLNLIPNQSPVIVHVNQYDTGTGRLIATLYEGNEPYSPNGTAVIQGTKPDGHGFQYTATLDGNVVTADLTEQMSPVAGDVRVQIVVTESSGVTGTFVFIMRVQPSALPSDADMSESDYPLIEEAIREAQEAVIDSHDNAENSEAWAQGTRGGIPVGPTDPTYEHSAEYWAQYAKRHAEAGISVCITQNLTKAQWDSHNIGDEDTWLDTVTERRGTRINDIFIVTGTATDSLDAYFLIYRSTTAYGDLQGTLLSKSIAYSGDQGYGITASWRIQDTQAKFTTYSTLGHHEKWIGSQGYRGTTRIGDIFLVLGVTSDTLTAYIMVYRSTTASGDLEGDCIGSVYSERGAQGERGDKGEPGKDGADGADGAPGAPGNGINSIVKTGTSGLVDTYTITMTNGDTATFTVTNGDKGDQGIQGVKGDKGDKGDDGGIDNTQLIKDTVGWTGKNLLKYPYYNKSTTNGGITFTVNNDGSVTVDGTATKAVGFNFTSIGNTGIKLNGDYIISGNPAFSASGMKFTVEAPAGRNNNVEGASDVKYTFNNAEVYNIRLWIYSGTTIDNVTIYPMIRRADITDPAYEPYHESVEEDIEQIYADNGVLGAKNRLNITMSTKTQDGLTFTVNDGSVTVNGTAVANGGVYLVSDTTLSYDGYILSGNSSTDNNKIKLLYYDATAKKQFDVPANGEVLISGTNGDICRVALNYYKGATFSNLTFKPMLRLASDPDDTYQPYAMTNRELTDSKADKTDVDSNIDELKSYFGILTTPVPSYVANTLPVLKRNITSAFYNGSLRGEIAAGNFKNVRPGDYIIGQATGSTYYVAMCDYRLGKGDQTNNANYPAYDTHHLGLMLFKPVGTTALWRGYGHSNRSWRVSADDLGRCPWNAALDADPTNTEAVGADNTNITRTYGSANASGYMGSFIRERIDAILLPQCFQADFGSANVLKYREMNGNAVATDKPSGGQGNWNGCTSGWGWYDRYLDLPSEVELYGSRIFGSGMDAGCQCEQLPLFRNAAIHDFYPRIDIWTKAVASSSNACYRTSSGAVSPSSASLATWACPLACVK